MRNIILILSLLIAGVSSQSNTLAPANTTTAPATTTAAPTPNCVPTSTKPSPMAQTYVYKTCLVMRFAGYFAAGVNEYYEIKSAQVDEAESNCGNQTATTNTTAPKLTIKFPCGTLEFGMGRNNMSQDYVTEIKAKILNNTFVNTTEMFKSSVGHYYKCNTEQVITGSSNQSGKLFLSNFAFEAYRDAPGTDFYRIAEECALDSSQVSDLVRIGVGICLVALVALVLIAYFVGRRRWAERSSYESV